MKFTFITFVILIVSSGSVIGDLEIYPGSQQDDHFTSGEDPSLYPLYVDPRWRQWNNDKDDVPFYKSNQQISAKLKERIRKLEEFVSRKRQKLKEDIRKSPLFNAQLPSLLQDNLEYRKLLRKNLDQYMVKYPNQHVLDDVRIYPDFTFHNDDDNAEDVDPNYLNSNKNSHETSEREELSEVQSNGPSDFAYPPSDPRFFEDNPVSVLEPVQTIPKIPTEDENYSTEEINQIPVNTRQSEQVISALDLQPNSDSTVEVVAVRPHPQDVESAGVYIIAVVAGISAAATVGLIAFAIGWYNLQKHVKSSSDVEYPAYGVTGPNKEVSPSGDRRLAQSAQMYHYQHQKQQIIAMERSAPTDRHGSISEADSEEENEEGDYTVYECPGLAPTGEMEVKNPLFQDDPTPAQTPQIKQNESSVQKK